MSEKNRIRAAIQERLQHLPQCTLAIESRLICKKLWKLLPKPPIVLTAFFPLRSEPDIRPFLQKALQRGVALYLPTTGERSFVLRKVHSLRNLPIGPWNIPEPAEHSPILDPAALQLALIPGRAFDHAGWRIGRGGAGYDRWIREQRLLNPKTTFLGIAFECQILPAVPHEEHDERLDGIVTACGLTHPLQHITYTL